jgi:ParB-like chromosome segregation protein Spo0J
MLREQIREAIEGIADDAQRLSVIEDLRALLHELSPLKAMPVDRIRWVPIGDVHANDYNPNSVARNEMRLLYVSIAHDGYTQPIVTVRDEASQKYVIVDGFHRYSTMRLNPDIAARTGGLLPIVVIDKPINDRMASTVRHNRARGKHSITGMASMVFSMLDNGWNDAAICAELGVEPDELVRLKHVTGFSKLFENVEYRRSWETKRQIQLRIDYQKGLHENPETPAS